MQKESEFNALQFQDSTARDGSGEGWAERERERESRRVRELHELLAERLAEAYAQVGAALGAATGGELSARWERDVSAYRWRGRAVALAAARSGLCFGHLDHPDEPPTYVGRIGLTDSGGESALIDWRAPAARPFYCATLAMPLGVTRRRRFRLAGTAPDEWVADFHDDVFDGSAAATTDPGSAADPALLAALTAPRGSTMRDIVTTIQAEQDAIIRLPLQGVVVIEGGPGTSKTAVALHRIAYLLYTYREQLARRGVLVVGPSDGFLRYISDVLPALGESAVVFTTPGRLRHGIDATAPDAPDVARLKGDLAMLDVLRRAVADRQELPGTPIPIELEDVTIEIDEAIAAKARRRARNSGLAHNAARAIFRDTLGTLLVRQAVERIERAWEDPPELQELLADLADLPELSPDAAAELSAGVDVDVRVELRTHPGFHAAVERLWPVLTPERVLADLLASRERIASAGGELDLAVLYRGDDGADAPADARTPVAHAADAHAADAQSIDAQSTDAQPTAAHAADVPSANSQAAGVRTADVHAVDGHSVDAHRKDAHSAPAWTVADAPLLDELAELLGTVRRAAGAAGPDRGYAAEVLSILEAHDRDLVDEDPDELRPTDFVTADTLATRQEAEAWLSVAERAAADRNWRFGHLVIDEAQELSPMDWHVLLRRCPSRSITAVGDLAQRSAPAGAHAWTDVLAPQVADRWTRQSLTVNYRTPAEIMELAATVLPEIGPGLRPPESVRFSGERPWERTVPAGRLVAEVRAAVAAEVAALHGDGSPGVGDSGSSESAAQRTADAHEVAALHRDGSPDMDDWGPGGAGPGDPAALRGTVAVIAADLDALPGDLPAALHTPVSAKGLEFDVVIVVDPGRIKAANPADLYVSLTRATRRLGLLHVEPA